jgi:outer membrane protein OmpA-like peptidoglycan-associated protein
MKNQQFNKPKPFISTTLFLLGFLFAAINVYGQTTVRGNSPELAQAGSEGPFIIQRESTSRPATTPSQPAAQSSTAVTTSAPVAAKTTTNAAPADSSKNYCKHELSIWGAGGLSTLLYDPAEVGDRSSRLGGGFGLGYTYYFNRNIGLMAGAELAFYNSKMEVDGLTDSYPTVDADGEKMLYNTTVNNYEETQRMTSVNIPLMLQFQTGDTHKFYASLGLKLGIPVCGKYKVAEGTTLTASGDYYDTFQQELYDQRDLGYGLFTGSSLKGDVDFKLSYTGTAEAGVKWRLSRVLSLYTGLYFEYGFNDVAGKHSDKFIVYNNIEPENFKVNSTLTSEYTSQGKTESFSGHVSPLAAGLKVRLGVNFGCGAVKEKAVEQKPAPVKEVTPAPPSKPVKEVAPEVQQQSRKAKALAIIASREKDEDEPEESNILPAQEVEEDLKRAVLEYGNSVKGMITIELEGYELDQSALSPKMEQILDEKIAQIKKTYGEDIRIICEGHTCNTGKAEYNLKLGLKRANVVRDYLIRKGGYSADKIEAISKGQTSPIVPNDTEANRKKNRRVVLIIKGL